jgi:predicted transposase YbfD/YdcC
VVTRRIWCDAAAADYGREALSFPGLRTLARVDRETRRRDGETTIETRYFASSLDPARVPAVRLLGLIRGHWGVENSLHYVKDRWWDEDRHICRRPGLAAGFTTLLTAAVTALRATGWAEADGSMRGAADALCWDIGRAISLVTDSIL